VLEISRHKCSTFLLKSDYLFPATEQYRQEVIFLVEKGAVRRRITQIAETAKESVEWIPITQKRKRHASLQ